MPSEREAYPQERRFGPKKPSANIALMLIAMVGGIFFGHAFPNTRSMLASFGNLFMALLQMCALPMLIVSILSAPRQLMHKGGRGTAKTLLSHYAASLILGACLSIAVGLLIRPGAGLDPAALDFLDRSHGGGQGGTALDKGAETDLLFFLIQVVPKNIFYAFSSGNVVSIMFFCLLAGAAMAKVTQSAPTQYFFCLCDEVQKGISVLLGWFMPMLPVGLFCLIGSQAIDLDSPVFHALRKFLLGLAICYGAMLAVYAFIFINSARCGLRTGIKELGRVFLTGFSTQSSLATLPVMQGTIFRQTALDQKKSAFSVSMGITLSPAGGVAFFSLSAIFLLQIYAIPLTPVTAVILGMGALLAGMASVSTAGLATLNLLTIVAEPLGLPHTPAVLLFSSIYPLLSSSMAAMNATANTSISALFGKVGVRR